MVTKTYEEQVAFNNALAMVVEIIDSLQQEQSEKSTKKNCNNCPHCVDRKDQYGWHFKGCFGGPYNGKFIAEIDECPLQGQGVNLKCWISRDECSGHKSNLYIGQQKPRRIPGTAPGFGMWSDYGEFMALPSDMFPELTYSDEPIEVELIIRKK